MTSDKRIAANRRNATKSTGPRTAAGRKRSSRNALRHGLSVSPEADAHSTASVEELALELARCSGHDSIDETARQIAIATYDLQRVRRVKVSILASHLTDRGGTPNDLERMIDALRKLDRYEQRALTRRKHSLRKIN